VRFWLRLWEFKSCYYVRGYVNVPSLYEFECNTELHLGPTPKTNIETEASVIANGLFSICLG